MHCKPGTSYRRHTLSVYDDVCEGRWVSLGPDEIVSVDSIPIQLCNDAIANSIVPDLADNIGR